MDVFEKKEFFSEEEKKVIEDLQNIEISKPAEFIKILYKQAPPLSAFMDQVLNMVQKAKADSPQRFFSILFREKTNKV